MEAALQVAGVGKLYNKMLKQISTAQTDVELASAFDALVSHMQTGRSQKWIALENRSSEDLSRDCK